MALGDGATRSITATIEGASPMFLPPLLPAHVIEGIRAYPATPVLEETVNSGVVRGMRTERVTLVAEAGGAGEAPAVSVAWYHLRSGAVEMAVLPAIPISATGPRSEPTWSKAQDWRTTGLMLFAGALAIILVASVLRRAEPILFASARRLRATSPHSETRASNRLRRAVAAR